MLFVFAFARNTVTHFVIVDIRFAIGRPLQESLVGMGRRHGDDDDCAVIGHLHGGVAEHRAGSGGTSRGTNALFRSRDSAPLAAAPDSA